MATGDTLIPNGTIDTFKLDKKATVIHSIVRSTDSDTNPSAPTWTSSTPTSSLITNSLTLTDEPTGNIVLVMYTSVNNPYTQTTPKPVLSVDNKVIASNSHSKYKGALIGNQVSGKIQVGNGTNGYESKVLENSEIGIRVDTSMVNVTLYNGEYLINTVNPTVPKGTILRRVGDLINYNGLATTDLTSSSWVIVNKWSEVATIPTHSTIALDNSNSPSSKWFKAISQGDNGVVGSVYGMEFTAGGDTGSFSQLTNGTTTDWNGSTVRTFVGHIPINAEVK